MGWKMSRGSVCTAARAGASETSASPEWRQLCILWRMDVQDLLRSRFTQQQKSAAPSEGRRTAFPPARARFTASSCALSLPALTAAVRDLC